MTAADPTWLDLRAPYDDAARQDSIHLVDRVATVVQTKLEHPAQSVIAVDIGAGTGNSARWFDQHLGARLPDTILRWVLIDTDQRALELAKSILPGAKTVVGSITQLSQIVTELRDEPGYGGPLVITASAVLDVLTRQDIEAIVTTIVQHSACGLFLLSINGDWRITPADPADEFITDTFGEHQQRHAKLGAAGATALMAAARQAGLAVRSHVTAWRMAAPQDEQMLVRFLRERVAAVIEQRPQQTALATAWLQRRMAQVAEGLSIKVDHLDVSLGG